MSQEIKLIVNCITRDWDEDANEGEGAFVNTNQVVVVELEYFYLNTRSLNKAILEQLKQTTMPINIHIAGVLTPNP